MRTLCLAGSFALAAAMPVALAGDSRAEDEDEDEDENGSEDVAPLLTIEQQMLAVSEQERKDAAAVPRDRPLVVRAYKSVELFVINWICEPLATGFRFMTLLGIFAPVVFAVPLVCVGERLPHRSDERSGTLWWYSFLIWSLERAGPTFIKVARFLFSPVSAPRRG